MFTKVKGFLVVAALLAAAAVPAGLISADAPAGASTTACGSSCTSPSVESLGTGQVLEVSGSSVVMAASSTTNSGEDWTPEFEGDVANAVAAGVLSAKLNMLYSTDQLEELQYAPSGVPSDKCLADSYAGGLPGQSPPFNLPNLSVVTAPCGITAASLWIVDASNEANGYVDLINAGYEAAFSFMAENNNADIPAVTSPFAEPAVLTVNSSSQVVLAPLSELGGVVSATQMWAAWSSPAQGAVRQAVQAEHRKSVAKLG
jgi:hypothetical protein